MLWMRDLAIPVLGRAMSEEHGFALVDPAEVVVGIDCSSFQPCIEIGKMKMAESSDGLKHVLEIADERGRASYSGPLPYMAQINAIGFLRREYALLDAKRTGYKWQRDAGAKQGSSS